MTGGFSDVDLKMARLYDEGMSPKQLAERFALCLSVVRGRLTKLRKHDLVKTKRGWGGRKPKSEPEPEATPPEPWVNSWDKPMVQRGDDGTTGTQSRFRRGR